MFRPAEPNAASTKISRNFRVLWGVSVCSHFHPAVFVCECQNLQKVASDVGVLGLKSVIVDNSC